MADIAVAPPETAESRRARNIRGAMWIVVSCLGASGMTVAVRYLSFELDSRMIAFLRSALGLWILIPWVLESGVGQFRFSKPWLHIVRGVLMGAALNLGFFAIANISMAEVTILFFLAPIFATALAGPFLGERVGVRRWSAVGAGFLGAMIILQPGVGVFQPAMIGAVVSALCFSVSLLLSKELVPADGARSVVLSSTAVAAVLTAPVAAPVWGAPSALSGWVLVVALIGFSTVRLYADVRAYAEGEAGFLAPFTYLRLVILAGLGWWLFEETPDVWTWLGGAVIVCATLYIARREAQLGKRIAGSAA